MKNLCFPIILLLLLSLQSCYQDADDKSECATPCSANFITVSVLISDQDGNPFVLDRFDVTKVATGEEITGIQSPSDMDFMRENGSYPIINDNYSGSREEFEVSFKGYVGDQIVVEENYTVGKDCCHVYYVSGDLELEITIETDPVP